MNQAISEELNATSALARLQKVQLAGDDAFVLQQELNSLIEKDGGGACPSAVAIDLFQTVSVMVGAEPSRNPHKLALSAFANRPKLLNGRLSNEQFADLIEFYDERHLPEQDLRVETISAPDSPYAQGGERWSLNDGPDLKSKPRELIVLSFTVTESNGDRIGRHFVILKEQSNNGITVVDPQKPTKDLCYILGYQKDKAGAAKHIYLLNPAGLPARTKVFELNTVFKVSIRDDDKQDHTSLGDVKQGIDETVRLLRGTDEFLSPREWRQRTAAFGLPGLDLPEGYGGSAWPATRMIDVFRHAGRYNLNFRDVVGGAHVRPLLRSSSPDVLEIVRQVAQGKAYIAIAITEPNAGSDVPAIQSTSKRVEGGYLLSGEKRFNARLEQATHVILFTQGTTGKKGKLSVFVVPIDTPGLEIKSLHAHGLTGNSFGGLKFQNLYVPESHRIGEDGQGLSIFFKHFLYWRLMQTAAAIGTGEEALDQMADRIKMRNAFGGPIGRFTHLQQPIGQYWTELRMSYALAKEAAALY